MENHGGRTIKNLIFLLSNEQNKKIKKTKTNTRKWSMKYKKNINCNNPKGFSQKQYCKYGRK